MKENKKSPQKLILRSTCLHIDYILIYKILSVGGIFPSIITDTSKDTSKRVETVTPIMPTTITINIIPPNTDTDT